MLASSDYIVVGAGVCGLTLAHRLRASHSTVKVIEKARGFGGRLCTRKWKESDSLFDHGAQGIPKTETLKAWFEEFEINKKLPVKEESHSFFGFQNHWILKGGISQIGRLLSEGIDTSRQVRVQSICGTDEGYKLQSTEGEIFFAPQVILTMPLPQVEPLLQHEDSNVGSYPQELKAISYQKCITFLVEAEKLGPLTAINQVEEDGFTYVNMQHRHGLRSPALAVFSSEQWASENFEESAEQIQISFQTRLNKLGVGGLKESQVHKWRYAFTEGLRRSKPFLKLPDHDIYICGEGLASGGIEGAILSANSLSKELLLTP